MNFKKNLPYLGIFAIGVALIGFINYKHNSDMTQIRTSYVAEKHQETELVAKRVENAFRDFYQGLRTMTQLPGVKTIDRYGKSFQEDSKLAVQQIYNNTYQNVTLSEVYLLPKSIDPDKIDRVTGKSEEPILTYDEFIVAGAAKVGEATTADAAADALPEEEIYEYRLMKTQLEYLSSNYPTRSTFEGLAVPAITGPPVVTCDISEFTKEDLLAGRDKSRTGIIYTLPVYDNAGAFHGAVSGIVRLNVLEKMIPAGSFGLSNQAIHYEGTTNPSATFSNATEMFRKGQPDTSLIYSGVRKLSVVDSTEWTLWAALPNSEFYELTSVKQANLILHFGWVAVIFLMFAMAFATWKAQTNAASLERQVNEKTAQLSSRNAAMKLVFDNSKEGFLTCGLDGSIGSEYSAIVTTWFGAPQAGVPLSKFLFANEPKKAEIFQISWDQLIEDFMPFDVTAQQMSGCFLRGDKWLSLMCTDIRAADNTLQRIMVVISDVTARVEAEANAQKQKEVMAVFQALQDDRSGFIEFFADAENLVKTLTSNLTVGGLDKENEFRLIHTLKGNCGQYGLEALAAVCHTLESSLAEGPDKLNQEQLTSLQDVWKETTARLMLLIGGKKTSSIDLDESEYLAILEKIKAGASHAVIATEIEKWKMLAVSKRLDRIGEQAKSLGDRLGVEDLKITVKTNNLRIHPDRFKNVWSSMIHVVRNSVDHGLKGITGRAPSLELTASGTDGENLVISVRDNGKGINWDRIREKAKKMGLRTDTVVDLENCLFADGLSTNEEVTTVSGRGVGMAAVKEAVLAEGGTIGIHSEVNKGTEFVFTLPMNAHKKLTVDANQAAAIQVMPNKSVKNKKVLILDDEVEMLTILEDMLTDIGCVVLKASNVAEGMNLIRATSDLDVIITDSRMGDERGLEIIANVLADRSLCQNLIMCSGFVNFMKFDERVFPLAKPFSEVGLLAALQTVLSRQEKNAA